MRWLSSLGLALVVSSISYGKVSLTVRVGGAEYPPFILCADHTCAKPTGPFVDYLEQIAEDENLKLVWNIQLPQRRMQLMLKRGELDIGIAGTPELTPEFKLSAIPFVRNRGVLFVRSDEPLLEVRSVEDIKGRSIGRLLDVPVPEFLKENKKYFSTIEASLGSQGVEQLMKQLLNGRAWAIYSPTPEGILIYAIQEKLLDKIKILKLPGSSQIAYYILMRPDIPLEIENRINHGLKAQEKKGSFSSQTKKLCEKHHLAEKCTIILNGL